MLIFNMTETCTNRFNKQLIRDIHVRKFCFQYLILHVYMAVACHLHVGADMHDFQACDLISTILYVHVYKEGRLIWCVIRN